MSEPRPDNSMFIPKSGSFSHFTCTKRVKSKSSTASQDPKLSILSCSELIETYCKDDTERRPESTPPSLRLVARVGVQRRRALYVILLDLLEH